MTNCGESGPETALVNCEIARVASPHSQVNPVIFHAMPVSSTQRAFRGEHALTVGIINAHKPDGNDDISDHHEVCRDKLSIIGNIIRA